MTVQAKLKVAPVRKSLQVSASQAHAFEVFTAGFGRWWPNTHHTSAIEMKDAIIEPHLGGRWYEVGEDGSQCDWGKVLAWEPPARLVLSWHLNGKFQYDTDVESEVEVHFIAENANVTRVELEHRIVAPDAEIIRAGVDSTGGWSLLLEMFAKEAAA
ncbi:MAG TPA: SRPBCC family protein [Rhizomicrobium sp.]|jgi:uncharacterized protein YndB with AHSA1/START domain